MWIIGILLIAAGVFLLVYGGLLFRFALAVGLFVLGFSLSMWLLSSQPQGIRLLISIAVGGVAAIVGYALVKLALHIAGGLLGAVAVLLVLSILPLSMPSILSLILILAGMGVVGFFGNRLGDWVIILSTTLAGSYAIISGITRLFPASVGVGADYVSALVPFTGPAFVVFLTVLTIGVLAQQRIRSLRGRFIIR